MNAPAGGNITELLKIENRLRASASKEELVFIFLNESVALERYTHSAWWDQDAGLVGHSGASTIDQNSSYSLWLKKLCAELHKGQRSGALTRDDVSADLAQSWSEFFPAHIFVVPVWTLSPERASGLAIFAFETLPGGYFASLATYLGGVAGHAYHALQAKGQVDLLARWHDLRDNRKLRWAAAAVFLILMFPLRLSVMAPVDVVPSDPFVIRSAADGVVKAVHVEPNSLVSEGTPLFDLDPVLIESRLDTAIKARAVAETELRQASQQLISDMRGRAYIASLNGRLEEKQVEVDYLRELKSRLTGLSPKKGIVIVDDPKALIGKPVVTGERVMSVVDEFSNEVEFWIPAQDLISLPPSAPVKVFLNTDPFESGSAEVKYLSYEPTMRPDGILAYRGRAILKNGQKRVGLRGVARVDSYRYPLIYGLLRRPVMIVRHYFGL